MPASNHPSATGRSRHHWWLVAVGAGLVVGGLVTWFAQEPGVGTTISPSARPSVAAAPVVARQERESPTATRVSGVPRRVLIPALGVNAAVLPIEATDGTLIPPDDPQQLGWWAPGARPGARTGSALVTGHTVHTGGGALDDLETLTSGDQVTVGTARGVVRYDVRRVAIYTKGALAEHAERLFDQDGPGRLVLVTCEDWDGTRYLSNVVVIATPVRP